MASSSRRTKRNNKRNNKQQSRSISQSSSGSQSTAPTYMVEEDSQGELVNRRMGVAWPTKVHTVVRSSLPVGGVDPFFSLKKRYPDHSSGQSLATSDEEDQFKTSPYEMISIADLNAAAAAAEAESRREKRVAGGRRTRGNRANLSSHASSPQYVTLSNRSEETSGNETADESTANIDSIVFDTVEELDRYQRIFGVAAARARSETSVINSSMTSAEREETNRHYIGVRSKRAVDRKLKPGQFFVYYEKPSGADIPIYHFPIQRYAYEGETYYAVMLTDTDVKMFPSISSLVQHYHTFSDVDPESGRLETFGLPV